MDITSKLNMELQGQTKFMSLSIMNNGKICIKIHSHQQNDVEFKHNEKLKTIEFGKSYNKIKIQYYSLSTNIFIGKFGSIEYIFETNTKISKKWFMNENEYKKFNQNVLKLWPKIKCLYLITCDLISYDVNQLIVSNFINLLIKC